jgi:hypothetical protein
MTDKNEGEGSRTAASSYYAKLRSFIREKRVDPAARTAKQFVEQHPKEAAQAERTAKAGPRPTQTEGLWKRARARVEAMIHKRIPHG